MSTPTPDSASLHTSNDPSGGVLEPATGPQSSKLEQLTLKKRQRSVEAEDFRTAQVPIDPESARKRSRNAISPAADSDSSASRYLIVHLVQCDSQGSHSSHRPASPFFDAPQLFGGDNKASALRGQDPVEDIDSY